MPPRRPKKKSFLLSVAALIVAMLALFFARPPVFFNAVLSTIARPFWYAEGRFVSGVETIAAFMHTKATLVEDNEALRGEQARLALRVADYVALVQENESLKETFGRESEDRDLLLAYVLVKPGRTPYDTIIVDVGRREGVVVGDAVFGGNDHLIGEVVEVSRRSAKVRLFSSPGETVDVLVGEGAFSLTAHGLGNGSFAIEVPRDLSIVEGDAVYVPMNPPSFFGTVEAVGSAAADPVKIVLFQSAVNIAELKWVMVGRGMPARFVPEEARSATASSTAPAE